MLLTRLPAGRLAEPVPEVKASLWAFPLVGLLVGVVAAAAGLAAHFFGVPDLIVGALALGVQIGLTGGLHEDGLADTADGLGGGRDREHALLIMRDSRLGTYGVLALVLIVLIRAAGFGELIGSGQALVALPMLAAASRAWMAVALVILPPARPDGLGHGASQGDGRQPAMVAAGLGALVLCLMGKWGLAALPAMMGAAILLGWQARRRIGGQTGDILGAIQITSETAGLIVLCTLF